MSTYVIRVHPARPGGRTLLRFKNPREVALHVVVANKCTLTHFQPATASYPMTLVCEAKATSQLQGCCAASMCSGTCKPKLRRSHERGLKIINFPLADGRSPEGTSGLSCPGP
jgi:hypothetical protein